MHSNNACNDTPRSRRTTNIIGENFDCSTGSTLPAATSRPTCLPVNSNSILQDNTLLSPTNRVTPLLGGMRLPNGGEFLLPTKQGSSTLSLKSSSSSASMMTSSAPATSNLVHLVSSTLDRQLGSLNDLLDFFSRLIRLETSVQHGLESLTNTQSQCKSLQRTHRPLLDRLRQSTTSTSTNGRKNRKQKVGKSLDDQGSNGDSSNGNNSSRMDSVDLKLNKLLFHLVSSTDQLARTYASRFLFHKLVTIGQLERLIDCQQRLKTLYLQHEANIQRHSNECRTQLRSLEKKYAKCLDQVTALRTKLEMPSEKRLSFNRKGIETLMFSLNKETCNLHMVHNEYVMTLFAANHFEAWVHNYLRPCLLTGIERTMQLACEVVCHLLIFGGEQGIPSSALIQIREWNAGGQDNFSLSKQFYNLLPTPVTYQFSDRLTTGPVSRTMPRTVIIDGHTRDSINELVKMHRDRLLQYRANTESLTADCHVWEQALTQWDAALGDPQPIQWDTSSRHQQTTDDPQQQSTTSSMTSLLFDGGGDGGTNTAIPDIHQLWTTDQAKPVNLCETSTRLASLEFDLYFNACWEEAHLRLLDLLCGEGVGEGGPLQSIESPLSPPQHSVPSGAPLGVATGPPPPPGTSFNFQNPGKFIPFNNHPTSFVGSPPHPPTQPMSTLTSPSSTTQFPSQSMPQQMSASSTSSSLSSFRFFSTQPDLNQVPTMIASTRSDTSVLSAGSSTSSLSQPASNKSTYKRSNGGFRNLLSHLTRSSHASSTTAHRWSLAMPSSTTASQKINLPASIPTSTTDDQRLGHCLSIPSMDEQQSISSARSESLAGPNVANASSSPTESLPLPPLHSAASTLLPSGNSDPNTLSDFKPRHTRSTTNSIAYDTGGGDPLQRSTDVQSTCYSTASSKVDVTKEPWYHGVLPRPEVEKLICNQGDFLIRLSSQPTTATAQQQPSTSQPTPPDSSTDPTTVVIPDDLPESERPFFLAGLAEGSLVRVVLSVFWNGPQHFYLNAVDSSSSPVGGGWCLEGEQFPTIRDLIEYHLLTRNPVTSRSGACLLTPITRPNWQLDNRDVQLGEKIGQGNFGEVYRAIYNGIDVAVKLCRADNAATATGVCRKFLRGETTALKFRHPHIVKLIGIAVRSHPILIVMEYVAGGSLLSYLRGGVDRLTDDSLLLMGLDAASGMAYLQSMQCIHRDLAARNCLVTENGRVKIADFGMSREEMIYELSDHRGQIPIKWTCPETLATGRYTLKSDVWSYGVLLWEIYSFGDIPYRSWTNNDTRQMVTSGYRLPAPDRMPPSIQSQMVACWHQDPSSRPSFDDLFRNLQLIAALPKTSSSQRLPTGSIPSSANNGRSGGGGLVKRLASFSLTNKRKQTTN